MSLVLAAVGRNTSDAVGDRKLTGGFLHPIGPIPGIMRRKLVRAKGHLQVSSLQLTTGGRESNLAGLPEVPVQTASPIVHLYAHLYAGEAGQPPGQL